MGRLQGGLCTLKKYIIMCIRIFPGWMSEAKILWKRTWMDGPDRLRLLCVCVCEKSCVSDGGAEMILTLKAVDPQISLTHIKNSQLT